MKIPISEIFESIQGEWRNTWKPSIFVRFWWCNLKCEWCDSKYSWDPSVGKADMMKSEDIIKLIRSFKSKHIIFTWWEPTLFQKQMKVIQRELELIWDYTYELETNWSNIITEDIYFDQINISPKLKSSWNKTYYLKILDSEDLWRSENVDFKFVCDWLVTCQETDKFINKISQADNFEVVGDIYIMPLWRDEASQVNDFLVKYCIKNNYKYCLRQHLIMFWDGKWK